MIFSAKHLFFSVLFCFSFYTDNMIASFGLPFGSSATKIHKSDPQKALEDGQENLEHAKEIGDINKHTDPKNHEFDYRRKLLDQGNQCMQQAARLTVPPKQKSPHLFRRFLTDPITPAVVISDTETLAKHRSSREEQTQQGNDYLRLFVTLPSHDGQHADAAPRTSRLPVISHSKNKTSQTPIPPCTDAETQTHESTILVLLTRNMISCFSQEEQALEARIQANQSQFEELKIKVTMLQQQLEENILALRLRQQQHALICAKLTACLHSYRKTLVAEKSTNSSL